MPTVHNKHHRTAPHSAIYCGRGSPYGNPYSHLERSGVSPEWKCETREEAIEKFRAWVQTQPHLMRKIKEKLKGEDLVCFCRPKACHCDVLIEIANEED